jgi:glycogen operon protein
MLIYELNVRGFSMRHPAIGPEDRGRLTALGSAAVLAHLTALGVTSVEIMPIHAFVDEEFLVAHRLRNFWGYNTLGFFALEPRYLGTDGIAGVRQAIDTLHDAGIEVILDVVYNHTAEGGRLGPTLSFRGLANDVYYRLRSENPAEYVNDTGCGNTLDTSEPVVRRLIVDSLRHWVEALGIDGFRFDLATAIARTAAGFDPEHPLFAAIRADEVLAGVKLIAEPWDVGPGGYRLGAFPRDWAEWNDQFRDTIRRFWCPQPGRAPDLARRVHGSSDIFEPGGRSPGASVNFITSHDGFTLTDLVSYVERHNEANGENNEDGHRHNFSVNHGAEGPTDDADIAARRRRHRINLLATLLFSQGTPMLLAGDEFGNSQSGNNNAYAQDNGTGWLDWEALAQDRSFFDEVCKLAKIRRELPLLRQAVYRHDDPAAATGHPEFEWFDAEGLSIPASEWPTIEALGILLSRPDETESDADGIDAVTILYSVLENDIPFRLPPIAAEGRWRWRFSSADTPTAVARDGSLVLAGFSVACLTHERQADRSDPHS